MVLSPSAMCIAEMCNVLPQSAMKQTAQFFSRTGRIYWGGGEGGVGIP